MKTYHHPTPELFSTVRALPWVLAVWLALGAPVARAATDAANAAALSTNLPASVTLAKASVNQVAGALHEAVKQHHDDAVDLLKIAVLAKTPRQGHGELSCDDLKKLVEAAATAAPDKASQLVEMAASLHPECADGLQNLTDGTPGPGEVGGFGLGLGTGFPGSPGFTGSAPSGASAVPPVVLPTPNPPVTPTVNN